MELVVTVVPGERPGTWEVRADGGKPPWKPTRPYPRFDSACAKALTLAERYEVPLRINLRPGKWQVG